MRSIWQMAYEWIQIQPKNQNKAQDIYKTNRCTMYMQIRMYDPISSSAGHFTRSVSGLYRVDF